MKAFFQRSARFLACSRAWEANLPVKDRLPLDFAGDFRVADE